MVLFLPAPTDRNPMTRLVLMCGLPGAGPDAAEPATHDG
jgi:hypothetical protein